MQVSVALPKPGEIGDRTIWRRMVAAAESFGLEQIAVDDGQNGDTFSLSGAAAAQSERALIAATMINPVTRNIGTVAASLGSVNFLSGRRARAVIARGDGAVRNVGLAPAGVVRTEAFIANLKTLLSAGQVNDEGRDIILRGPFGEWAQGIPVGVVAEGPRMLGVAGRNADLVFIGFGLTAPAVQAALGHLDAGLAEAGRGRDDIEQWWVARLSLHADRRAAVEQALTSIESMGNHALRGRYSERLVPAELHEPLAAYHAGYDYRFKGVPGGPNIQLMDKLGLTDYFFERFSVVGDPGDVTERLRQLALAGVERVHVRVHGLDELVLLGQEVLPALPEG
jgi:5,10-methylenetetrahydromethanopterin reductase